jgi:hypothetical protein
MAIPISAEPKDCSGICKYVYKQRGASILPVALGVLFRNRPITYISIQKILEKQGVYRSKGFIMATIRKLIELKLAVKYPNLREGFGRYRYSVTRFGECVVEMALSKDVENVFERVYQPNSSAILRLSLEIICYIGPLSNRAVLSSIRSLGTITTDRSVTRSTNELTSLGLVFRRLYPKHSHPGDRDRYHFYISGFGEKVVDMEILRAPQLCC